MTIEMIKFLEDIFEVPAEEKCKVGNSSNKWTKGLLAWGSEMDP